MDNFEFEIRTEMLRVQPEFTVAEANDLISGIADCYEQIRADDELAGNSEWEDFFDFSFFKDTALATIYRSETIEVFVFHADESLIDDSKQLAMTDADDFLDLIRRKFNANTALTFPISVISGTSPNS